MNIVQDDAKNIAKNLGSLISQFEGCKILITGHTGFLGSNFCAFFQTLNNEFLKEKVQVTCIDSKIVDLEDVTSDWLEGFTIIKGDATHDLPDTSFDWVIHCAGIASPTYYRKFPLQTIEVNAINYWHMLEKINQTKLKGFLYFSTSEVYGNPDPKFVPTPEEYNGNVSCTGPRACYDESKRMGETISISFVEQKNIPIKLVRPFNVYGPFMRLNDKRVLPDFMKSALEEKKITMYSDGTPKRSFCYVSDALEGFLRVLLLGKPGRPYNVGNDEAEITMGDLATEVAKLVPGAEVLKLVNKETAYLTDNPMRRCPILTRAKEELKYHPKIMMDGGIPRVLNWYKETYNL